jgi:hypothetical protein
VQAAIVRGMQDGGGFSGLAGEDPCSKLCMNMCLSLCDLAESLYELDLEKEARGKAERGRQRIVERWAAGDPAVSSERVCSKRGVFENLGL